ncbi:MAG TPA: 50S ribosomal protein L30 [Candidatus Sulfotelmatobacter sp.]|jgi:large subunit ribosomal protein L30|nr:50S ribosomal protein L30 [Candidatus Sulfotelmatobacter sp.]
MAEKKTSTQKSGSKGMVRIQWVRSYISAPVKHKKIVKGLGFTRLNQIVEREDTPSIRGMVKKIPHLLEFVS